ncbi:MAG TPA: ATP-binding protein [Gemmatimonadaceae bacterium]|nr:ATP-binding protein [Gemmatimonadaceae bacterium]
MKPTPHTLPLATVALESDLDVLRARHHARLIAEALGLGHDDRTRFATAVCEIARNARASGPGPHVQFLLERSAHRGQCLVARITGTGPAMRDLEVASVESDGLSTPTDSGIPIVKQLVEHFRIQHGGDGLTVVEVGHPLLGPAQPLEAHDAARISALLSQSALQPAVEAQRQNRELVWALTASHNTRMQVEWLNSELEATNRGVMALYAELDDRAEDLKRISEHKSRFLSDVSHELRTPMTSVLNLTRLLLDRADGPLTDEQQRQVSLIRNSVQTVTELVNDLLDIARIEAGHSTLRYRSCTVGELLAALRGICRPLLTSDAVNLAFDDDEAGTMLETDDARVAQILRNLLSNAIKFTERGEIRVSVRVEMGDMIRFDVRDTGIGIAPADQERIFDEFTQLDSPLQRRVHGSGLGLRLSRNLAMLLGGRIELVSAPGRGSTFSLMIPRRHPGWAVDSTPNRETPHEVTVP